MSASGVSDGGLTTTMLPAIRIGPRPRKARLVGEFQGTINAATPIGCRTMTTLPLGLGSSSSSPRATRSSSGTKLDPASWEHGHFLLPAVVTGVDHTFDIVTCEQFGPVIPILPFDDDDEAIGLANDSPFGLTSSVWTNDLERADRLARRIEAGSTFINVHRGGATGVDMPHGGFKESGLGRGHGVIALEGQFELHTISTHRPC